MKAGNKKGFDEFWWVLSFDVLKWLEGTMFNVSARFVNPKDFPEVFYYAEAPWTVDMVGHGI